MSFCSRTVTLSLCALAIHGLLRQVGRGTDVGRKIAQIFDQIHAIRDGESLL